MAWLRKKTSADSCSKPQSMTGAGLGWAACTTYCTWQFQDIFGIFGGEILPCRMSLMDRCHGWGEAYYDILLLFLCLPCIGLRPLLSRAVLHMPSLCSKKYKVLRLCDA